RALPVRSTTVRNQAGVCLFLRSALGRLRSSRSGQMTRSRRLRAGGTTHSQRGESPCAQRLQRRGSEEFVEERKNRSFFPTEMLTRGVQPSLQQSHRLGEIRGHRSVVKALIELL